MARQRVMGVAILRRNGVRGFVLAAANRASEKSEVRGQRSAQITRISVSRHGEFVRRRTAFLSEPSARTNQRQRFRIYPRVELATSIDPAVGRYRTGGRGLARGGRFSTANRVNPALCRNLSRTLLGQRALEYRAIARRLISNQKSAISNQQSEEPLITLLLFFAGRHRNYSSRNLLQHHNRVTRSSNNSRRRDSEADG